MSIEQSSASCSECKTSNMKVEYILFAVIFYVSRAYGVMVLAIETIVIEVVLS